MHRGQYPKSAGIEVEEDNHLGVLLQRLHFAWPGSDGSGGVFYKGVAAKLESFQLEKKCQRAETGVR